MDRSFANQTARKSLHSNVVRCATVEHDKSFTQVGIPDSEADSTSHEPVREGTSFKPEYRSGQDQVLEGHFVTDQFGIGASTLQSLRFAVMDTGDFFEGGGILGLSFNTGEFAEHGLFKYQYPDFLDTAYKDGIIGKNSFALYIRNRGDRDLHHALFIETKQTSRS